MRHYFRASPEPFNSVLRIDQSLLFIVKSAVSILHEISFGANTQMHSREILSEVSKSCPYLHGKSLFRIDCLPPLNNWDFKGAHQDVNICRMWYTCLQQHRDVFKL